jgi:hypothetical protein
MPRHRAALARVLGEQLARPQDDVVSAQAPRSDVRDSRQAGEAQEVGGTPHPTGRRIVRLLKMGVHELIRRKVRILSQHTLDGAASSLQLVRREANVRNLISAVRI